MADEPKLSVIVVSPLDFAYIRRTVSHLRDQTIANQIELIPVAPNAESLEDATEADYAGFAEVNPFYTGEPIENVDDAAGLVMLKGKSDIVACVEDHAFPEPGWAEAILAAHDGTWAMIGSAVINANPDSGLSWANQLMAYGHYSEPIQGGERSIVSRHNASYKKSVLEAYGDRLQALFIRGGGLIETLRADGHKMYLAEHARIHHLNPSNISSTSELRFFAGRLAAGSKGAREGWSLPKRLIEAMLCVLQPVRRFKRIAGKVFSPVQRGRLLRLLPALAYVMTLDGLGQFLGCLIGPGKAGERLAEFEYDRLRHLNAKDRSTFSQPV
ncbi:MAG: hypothetical protein AAGB26_06400 [Planctomycetota bacterium]